MFGCEGSHTLPKGKQICKTARESDGHEMLYRVGTEVQDIFENLVIVPLPEGQEDDVYQQAVRALNTHFPVQKNAAYERHVLPLLKQEPGEDVDSFVLRLRKQARHCSYGEYSNSR